MDEMPNGAAIKQLFRAISECNTRKAGAVAEAKEQLNNAVAQHGLNKAALLECIRLAKWSKARRDSHSLQFGIQASAARSCRSRPPLHVVSAGTVAPSARPSPKVVAGARPGAIVREVFEPR
jgi:hypothetical protein